MTIKLGPKPLHSTRSPRKVLVTPEAQMERQVTQAMVGQPNPGSSTSLILSINEETHLPDIDSMTVHIKGWNGSMWPLPWIHGPTNRRKQIPARPHFILKQRRTKDQCIVSRSMAYVPGWCWMTPPWSADLGGPPSCVGLLPTDSRKPSQPFDGKSVEWRLGWPSRRSSDPTMSTPSTLLNYKYDPTPIYYK
jgi:hypothetical protein